MNEDEFSWTQESAVYQITNGEMGTARTDSAFDYLEDHVNALGAALLSAIHRLRREAPK